MQAFVLPGYSEGLIRLNVQGRDGPSGMPPARFGAVCDELTELLGRLVDPLFAWCGGCNAAADVSASVSDQLGVCERNSTFPIAQVARL